MHAVRLDAKRPLRLLLFMVTLAGTASPAHATLLVSCRPTDTRFLCTLRSVLSVLDVVAGILAFLLCIAIAAAVAAYRRRARTPSQRPSAK